MRKKINQLDLFSGIGGFHMGFERAGYKVKSYFSEIDKHAIAVYKHKFKDAEYVGSVTDVRGADLPKIDLITFGSPCQDFSLAGRRKGMDGERSSLILEAIRLIGECRPGVFVWENVKGTFSSNAGQDFAAILQAFANIGGYRLEWQLCNTANYLPQNRERIYLVGYSTSTKRDWKGIFPLPSNDGQDPQERDKIREASKPVGHRGTGGQQGKVYSDQGHSPTISAYTSADPTFVKVKVGNYIDGELEVYRKGDGKPLDPSIAPTITATEKSGGNHSDMAVLKVKSATKAGYEEATGGDSINLSQPNSETRRGRVGKGRAQTLETSCNQGVVQPVQIGQSTKTFAHKSGTLIGKEGQDAFTIRSSNPNGVKVEQPIAGRVIGRNPDDPKSRVSGLPTEQMLEINERPDITNTLTTVQKDNMVVQSYSDIEIGDIRYDEGGFRPRKNGIAPALVGSNDKSGTPKCSILKINDNMVEEPIVHGAITQAIGRGGSSSEYMNSVKSINEAQPNYQIRRLTPIECERLQGFPDNHTAVGVYDGETKPISNTQRYKMCGNAVTVDVVHAIAKQITKIL